MACLSINSSAFFNSTALVPPQDGFNADVDNYAPSPTVPYVLFDVLCSGFLETTIVVTLGVNFSAFLYKNNVLQANYVAGTFFIGGFWVNAGDTIEFNTSSGEMISAGECNGNFSINVFGATPTPTLTAAPVATPSPTCQYYLHLTPQDRSVEGQEGSLDSSVINGCSVQRTGYITISANNNQVKTMELSDCSCIDTNIQVLPDVIPLVTSGYPQG
jgi:hypothetical protein